jgi:polysaccharide biosynthesis transport protein
LDTPGTTPVNLPPYPPPAVGSAVPPSALADGEVAAMDGSALGYSPGRVLKALRRRWLVAGTVGVLMAVALGGVANEYIRPYYTARTQVYVAINQPFVLTDTGSADPNTYQRRQVALVRSRPVLQNAVSRRGVADLPCIRNTSDPVGWLEADLKVDFTVAPEIMKITLTGPDADELLVLLDAIREAYLQEGVNKEVTDKRAARERLLGLIDEDRTKLEEARRSVSRKAEEFRAPDAVTARHRHQSNLTRLSNLQTHQFVLEGRVRTWEESKADLIAHPPTRTGDQVRPEDVTSGVELAVERDVEARILMAEIARLEAEVKEVQRVGAEGRPNPKLAEKEKELEAARGRRTAREKVLRADVLRRLTSNLTEDFESRVREHTLKVEDLKTQAARARGELAATVAEIQKLDTDTLVAARGIAELDRLDARAAEIEDRIKVAKKRAEELEIELRAPARARTQEEAVITQVPNPAKKMKMVAVAVAVGFLAGLAGIAYLDLRTGRIDSPDGVDRHLHTGVVGCVPRVPAGAIAALTRADDAPPGEDSAGLCDAVDACRALLLHALPGSQPRVVMVSSATAGEGKTSLAGQLALSLGRAGYRTLLIDADLRKPAVHALFGRSQNPGLADVLRRTYPVERVGRKTSLSNVLVMPAGYCHPNEAVSLLQLRLGSVLRKCKPFFDVILIDTPPLSVPDALVIGRYVDGTILSLMNEVSTLPAAQAACARLRAMHIPLLGAVLNGARVRTPLGY